MGREERKTTKQAGIFLVGYALQMKCKVSLPSLEGLFSRGRIIIM